MLRASNTSQRYSLLLLLWPLLFCSASESQLGPPRIKKGVAMSPTARLTVDVSGKAVLVHITIANPSGDALLYLERYKVLAMPPVRVNLFEITCDGKAIGYIGALAKRRAPERADFVEVLPGGEIQGLVDIADLYAFLPGRHAYIVDYVAFHGDPEGKGRLVEIRSRQATFTLTR